jgi:hypothetical protein
VVVNRDTAVEPNETFFVNLSSCVNCTITDAQGMGTIVNDDAVPPTISINDVSQNEGNPPGTTNFVFTVTRSGNLANPSSLAYQTADGTATAPSDYTAIPPTTLNFAANQPTATVTVVVNRDTAVEPNETFFVNLSSCVNCTITDAQGMGTIVNDDAVLDTDGDGVPDDIDECPNEPGPATNNGCPVVTEQPVGGEILGIDMITLFVAATAANAGWIIPVVAGTAALVIIGIRRILKK